MNSSGSSPIMQLKQCITEVVFSTCPDNEFSVTGVVFNKEDVSFLLHNGNSLLLF